MTNKIEIVAEIGCNHNGDKELAKKLVAAAKECGVDAVKFQTFNSEALISKHAPKAEYQKVTTSADESQLEMTRKLELSRKDFLELRAYAENLNLSTFSTPFDLGSIDFLIDCGQAIWKIPSGEITNLPYLEKIGAIQCRNKRVILSTGMATIEEIKTAVDILNKAGTKNEQIILLHCNTEYPTSDQDVNLSAIDDLKRHFSDIKIGFSDHSVGSIAAIAAAAKGICMIEKHFTLDKDLFGPDHKASATPDELKAICEGVRKVQMMLGCGEKIVTESEKKNKIIARKSIVAACEIKKGDIFTEQNITCKRPGNGISPMNWYKLLGKSAERDFCYDELIEHSDFNRENDN